MRVVSLLRMGLLLCCIAGGLPACDTMTPAEKRAQRAEQDTGDVVVGIVDTRGVFSFRRGAELAIEELNQQGGVSGRRIKPLFYDDGGSADKGLQISEKLSKQNAVVAVIGHAYSRSAIPASITYFENGVLFLSPSAQAPSLTRYGFWTTFRNNLSSEESGRQVAVFASRRDLKRIAVIYDRSESTTRLSQSFLDRAVKLGISIPMTKSYFDTDRDFRTLLAEIAEEEFDAVFLAGTLPTAAALIKQAREIGITTPLLGGDGLDGLELLHIAGKAAEGTIVPTVFSPQQPVKATQDFVDRFEARFGLPPGTWDAQGYDAVQVLTAAMRKSGSTVPRSVATALQFLKRWEGVTGSYSFTSTGDIRGKQLFFKEVRKGQFQFLSSGVASAMQIDPSKVVTDVTIRIPLETPLDTLDPGKSVSEASYEVIDQLFLGLTAFDPTTYDAVPELAERWTVSDDGLTYTFHLRQGVTWTDGTPVTADDMAWTLRRNLHPDTAGPNVARLYLVKNARALHQEPSDDLSALGVRALDDLTVEFTLEYPAVYFPKLLDLPIYRPLPRQAIEAHGNGWTNSRHIQTNAAYHLGLWQPGVVAILRKNAAYYNAEHISIPEVRYYIISNPTVGLAMYKNHELDVLGSAYLPIPAEELAQIRSDPVLRNEYSQQQKSCTNALVLHPRYPLSNVAVRRALALVTDRQFMLDFVLRGEGQLTGSLLPPGISRQAAPIGLLQNFSPEHARLWLEKAGYTGDTEFPMIAIECPASSPDDQIMQIFRETIEHELGIPTECAAPGQPRRSPHITLMRKCADYPDASSFLEDFHPEQNNSPVEWGSNNRSALKFGELLERARTETQEYARTRLYARAEQLLTQHGLLVVPLYFEISPSLVKPRVQGWHHNVLGGQYIGNWHFQE